MTLYFSVCSSLSSYKACMSVCSFISLLNNNMKHILNSDCGSEFSEIHYFQSRRWGRLSTESPHSVIIVIDSFSLFCSVILILSIRLTDSLSVGRQCVSAGYLSLWVAAPGVNVSCGGEHQSVFSSHSHILDVDPWQSRHLLGPVVVPGSAFREAN